MRDWLLGKETPWYLKEFYINSLRVQVEYGENTLDEILQSYGVCFEDLKPEIQLCLS